MDDGKERDVKTLELHAKVRMLEAGIKTVNDDRDYLREKVARLEAENQLLRDKVESVEKLLLLRVDTPDVN